jgi:hypothetical protein
MSSLFELNERVRRLRETFLYFKNAALLTGAEIRDSDAIEGERARIEWARLLEELRACLEAAESVMARDRAAAPRASSLAAKALSEFAEICDPASTRH